MLNFADDALMSPNVTPCVTPVHIKPGSRDASLVWKTCSRCLWQIPSTHVIPRQW